MAFLFILVEYGLSIPDITSSTMVAKTTTVQESDTTTVALSYKDSYKK
jgi:hypothetical protein